MLACDSARVDVVLGEHGPQHGPQHSEIPSALGRALSLHLLDHSKAFDRPLASIECNHRNPHCVGPQDAPSIPSA
ncbi:TRANSCRIPTIONAL REGULATORY protein [Enhygromyxa salina]|uniref:TRANSCRIPTIONAL REGULATORY protein n=1 Tax=Enhygromyxa salina TaxID=215803 RepID=A0A0C1ZDK2_9BACT|nr:TRANSCRIPTIONAL REGULATORY protein [Enhygromyxa salina]